MFHTTPREITTEVSAFCKSISVESPVYLDIQPCQYARQQECFSNVKSRISADAGNKVFGWVIWYHPGVFIEAEHHCVWQNGSGDLIDITRPPSGESRVLFLRDDKAKPFEVDGVVLTGRNSVRKALNKDPLVTKFVNYGTKIGQARVQKHRGLKVDPNTPTLVAKMARVQAGMEEKFGDAYDDNE